MLISFALQTKFVVTHFSKAGNRRFISYVVFLKVCFSTSCSGKFSIFEGISQKVSKSCSKVAKESVCEVALRIGYIRFKDVKTANKIDCHLKVNS